MTPSQPSGRGQIQPVLAVALGVVAVVAIAAAVALNRPASPAGASPTDRPSAPPSAAPAATPLPTPSTAPSSTPSGVPSVLDLRNATNHDVTLRSHGETDSIVAARSGTPGDGMSAQWHKAVVKNLDARTIQVTWAGLPKDDQVDLDVALDSGTLRLTFVQAGPIPYSDAMGEDRVVVLTFDHAVSAKDVAVEILDRTVD